jgi:5-methylcytosine-specific restriction enzyme subunit McrC
MKLLTTREYARIPYSEMTPKQLERLHEFDHKRAVNDSATVFDWSFKNYLRVQNYVGVIQVPGLTVEILPKIDQAPAELPELPERTTRLAQQNLLYMLSITQNLPFRERNLASLETKKLPVLDALIAMFADRLRHELNRGVYHTYVHREENIQCIKGKLLISEHIKRNIVRRDRVYVGFDEFDCDSLLNRILKAGCLVMLGMVRDIRTQKNLREALLYFDDVSHEAIGAHDFDVLHLDRQSERFAPLIEFCRIVLTQRSPAPQTGKSDTFSLLFPMEQLFEQFIGYFIQRHASAFGLTRDQVRLQARGRIQHLLRRENRPIIRMKPDIHIGDSKTPALRIVDTKWKRLKSDAEDRRNGVAQADLYQLYAYATRYKCPRSVLLYPKISGATGGTFTLEEDEATEISVAQIDLNRDLRREKAAVVADLKTVLDL